MKIYKNINISLKFILVYLLFFILFFQLSCGKKDSIQSPVQELARVNNYSITTEDYEMQKKKSSYLQSLDNSAEYKEHILNLMIDNALLLQEADKLKINQNKDFLKSIEHFWRQSLIQELIKIKMREINKNITISENDLKSYYSLLKEKYYVRIVKFSALISKQFVNSQELDAFISEKSSLPVKDTGYFWTDFMELEPELKKQLLINKDFINKIFVLKNKTATSYYIVSKTENNPGIESFESMKPEIQELLIKELEQKQLEDWLKDLRKNSKVEINADLISKV